MNKLVFVSYFKNTIEFQETDRKKKLFIFDLNRSLYTSHCLFNRKMNWLLDDWLIDRSNDCLCVCFCALSTSISAPFPHILTSVFHRISALQLTASIQKDQCEISLTAQNRGTSQARDLQGQLNIKSSMWKTTLRSMSLIVAHKDNGRRFDNNMDLKVNGKAFSYVMGMNVDSNSNNGDITVTWPKEQVRGDWLIVCVSECVCVWGKGDSRRSVHVLKHYTQT